MNRYTRAVDMVGEWGSERANTQAATLWNRHIAPVLLAEYVHINRDKAIKQELIPMVQLDNDEWMDADQYAGEQFRHNHAGASETACKRVAAELRAKLGLPA